MLLLALLFCATIVHFKSYSSVVMSSGDNGAYLLAASAIRHWNFHNVDVKQFWGYSYVMAGVSLTGLSLGVSLLVVSILSWVVSIAISFRLWGGVVAALFAISNFDWMQRSLLGGSEPLFVLFLFASFWAIRAERWSTAALLASFATITRPVGLIALLALGLILLSQRRYGKTLWCTAIALGAGALYVLPFWLYFGDPLYQVHRYRTADWHSGSAIGWPLQAIIQSLIHNREPWTNVVLTTAWILFAIAGALALLFRKKALTSVHEVEWLFALLYVAFLLCYSSPEWARADFPRFVIPAVPILFVALADWLPRDRRIIWAIAVISPILSAASALGIRNVMAALHG